MKALKKEADERLLIEAAQHDPACFAELYEINFERVYAYVVKRVGNRTETEDLTSEVFHQALANLKANSDESLAKLKVALDASQNANRVGYPLNSICLRQPLRSRK